MKKKGWQTSLVSKINALKEDESMVVFGDYVKIMRNIGGHQTRGYINRSISYKKALVIVDDLLMIGCLITKEKSPKEEKKRDVITITHNGETLKIIEWAKKTGIARSTILARYKKGLETNKIFAPPKRQGER